MRVVRLWGVPALATLIAALVPALASSAECSAEDGGEESDGICALQSRRSEGRKLQAAPTAPHVQCNSTPKEVLPGSRSDMKCSGNQCCSQYGWTFRCPSASPTWDSEDRCTYATIQPEPTQPLLNPNPGTLPPAADPDQPARAPNSFGDVTFKSGQSLEDAIMAHSDAIVDVKVLRPGEQGYEQGFNSSFLNLESDNDAYQITHAYPGLWGDVGPLVQPGMGGVRTFNVVNITIGANKALELFRLSWFYNKTEGGDPRRMCSIWWGFESTYSTTQIEASRNVAICGTYNTMVRCDVTGSFTFTALVGQGFPLNQDGFMERTCTQASGNNQPTHDGDFVTKALVGKGAVPGSDVLQVVVPFCQIAQHMAGTCKACKLPDNVTEHEQIQDLAAAFKSISEKKPERCTSQLFEFTPPNDFAAEPFSQTVSDFHR